MNNGVMTIHLALKLLHVLVSSFYLSSHLYPSKRFTNQGEETKHTEARFRGDSTQRNEQNFFYTLRYLCAVSLLLRLLFIAHQCTVY